MRFYSFKFFIPLLLSCSILHACGFKREENSRKYIPAMDLGKYQKLIPGSGAESDFLPELYEPAVGLSSCEWLESLPKSTSPAERFRMLGNWTIGAESQLRFSSVIGMVDISASPLYQYALLSQAIPDKAEFLALLDQEYQKAVSFGDTLKLGLVKFLLNMGILNPYSLRNSVVQSKMDEAFPGAFFEEENRTLFPESIPGIVFRNGNPLLPSLSYTPSDDDNSQKQKKIMLQSVFTKYNQPLRLFSKDSWQSFSVDMQTGLTSAIRGYSTKNPAEQACSTILIHRAFAQMLSVMGYNKPPVKENVEEKISYLPSFSELLTSPTDNTILTCKRAGSFTKAGVYTQLSREDLASEGSALPFLLAAKPYTSPPCDREEALKYAHSSSYSSQEHTSLTASASELLAFLNGVVNFSSAFNPGASWWRREESMIGYPLSPFESLDRIKSSGAIIPADAHALSLGFLSLSFDELLKQHLLFIDENNKELTTSSGAAGVRIAEQVRKTGSIDKLSTSIQSASYLVEIAFKFSHTLSTMAQWKTFAEDALREDLLAQQDRKKQREIQKDYDNFIESMFGSEGNLERLTSDSLNSIRSQLKDLRLASAVLGISFAKKLPDGKFTCFAQIITDPVTGVEEKTGLCNPDEERQWKYSMALVAKAFRSPLFAEIGQ